MLASGGVLMGSPRAAAAPTMAAASGWDDPRSTHAASRSTSASECSPRAWTCATCSARTAEGQNRQLALPDKLRRAVRRGGEPPLAERVQLCPLIGRHV